MKPLLALLLVVPALAQQTQFLTLEEAFSRAQAHPSALAAAERVRAAQMEAKAEAGAYWPELDLAATTSRGYPGSSGGLGIAGMNNSPFRHQYGAALEARATLWDFGRTLGRVHAADQASERSTAQKEALLADLRLEVSRRYFTALSGRAQLEAAKERTVAAAEIRDQVKAIADAGLRPLVELALAEADLLGARSAEIRARTASDMDLARLAVLVGDDPRHPREPVPLLPEGKALPPLEAALARLESTPELRAAEAGLREAQARKEAALGERLPKLVASGSLGYANTSPGQDPGRWAVAVGLSIPVFRGGRDLYRVQATEARIKEQEYRKTDLQQLLRMEVVDAHRQAQAAAELMQAADAEASGAREAMEAARAGFQAGLVTYADVGRALAAWAEADARRAEARSRFAISRAELERLTGP